MQQYEHLRSVRLIYTDFCEHLLKKSLWAMLSMALKWYAFSWLSYKYILLCQISTNVQVPTHHVNKSVRTMSVVTHVNVNLDLLSTHWKLPNVMVSISSLILPGYFCKSRNKIMKENLHVILHRHSHFYSLLIWSFISIFLYTRSVITLCHYHCNLICWSYLMFIWDLHKFFLTGFFNSLTLSSSLPFCLST